MSTLGQIARTLRWYVREFTGEAKWDAYADECARLGEEPLSRREFERLRDHEREHMAGARCC